jgi:hypothetical protein
MVVMDLDSDFRMQTQMLALRASKAYSIRVKIHTDKWPVQ